MSVWRTLVLAAVLMLLVPVLGMVLMSSTAGSSAEAPTDLRTPYIVKAGDVQDTISAVGRLEANQTVSLNFRMAGRVSEVLVQLGQTIKAGDVLARLESTNQQLSFDQAMLAYEQAQIAVQELLNSPTEAELTAAQAALTAAQGSYAASVQTTTPEEIAAAEIRYQQAQQQVTDLQTARVNMSGELPQPELQLADARIGAANFNAEIARLQLENLRIRNRGPAADAGAGVALARLQLERVMMGSRPEQIALAQAAVQRAEVRVTEAQVALDQATLTAPVDGVVTRVGVQVGQTSDQASSAFEVSDLSRLWLTANVDEVDVDRVFIGLPTEVRLDALPGEGFGATVQQIALLPVVVNGVVNYPARFRIESDDDRLRAGMTAEVRVVIDQRSNVLSVPNEYIIQEGDRTTVTRLSPTGETQPVEVVTGMRGDTHTEIISGLREGDQLIVGSAAIGTEGQ